MARSPATFRQQDVTRALRATVAAGIAIERVEIARDGRIVIVTASAPAMMKPDDLDDLDRELEQFEAHHGKD
jgi:hypothetical protein